jgi:hypothetical protein
VSPFVIAAAVRGCALRVVEEAVVGMACVGQDVHEEVRVLKDLLLQFEGDDSAVCAITRTLQRLLVCAPHVVRSAMSAVEAVTPLLQVATGHLRIWRRVDRPPSFKCPTVLLPGPAPAVVAAACSGNDIAAEAPAARGMMQRTDAAPTTGDGWGLYVDFEPSGRTGTGHPVGDEGPPAANVTLPLAGAQPTLHVVDDYFPAPGTTTVSQSVLSSGSEGAQLGRRLGGGGGSAASSSALSMPHSDPELSSAGELSHHTDSVEGGRAGGGRVPQSLGGSHVDLGSVVARPMLGAARHGVVAVLQLYLTSEDDGPRLQTLLLEELRARGLARTPLGVHGGKGGSGSGAGAGAGAGAGGGGSSEKADAVGLLRVLFELLEVSSNRG